MGRFFIILDLRELEFKKGKCDKCISWIALLIILPWEKIQDDSIIGQEDQNLEFANSRQYFSDFWHNSEQWWRLFDIAIYHKKKCVDCQFSKKFTQQCEFCSAVEN